MIGTTALRTGAIVALALATGCSNLPRGAALESEIRASADAPQSGYAFYPVSRALLPAVADWPALHRERSDGWISGGGGSLGQVVAPGDVVEITIWDSADNSLLTPNGQKSAKLGAMTVSPSGRIYLPYAGEIAIAGMGTDRAREAIQTELGRVAPSSQVQLSVVSGRQNTVDLVGGVGRPGSFPMPDRNYSVLGLIAAGGGIPPSLRNPQVKLQRGVNVYATSADRLYDQPALDTRLVGGDKVIVQEDQRYFLSLGAAGKESIVYFTQDRLNALEAIALIGGIVDTRADPEGILVLREYPNSALAAGERGPRETRVIFAIDLTQADGLFSAQNLEIQPRDVVLATESPVGSLQLALAILGSGIGTARLAAQIR
jgi:polysaccharide export outer membrane protein